MRSSSAKYPTGESKMMNGKSKKSQGGKVIPRRTLVLAQIERLGERNCGRFSSFFGCLRGCCQDQHLPGVPVVRFSPFVVYLGPLLFTCFLYVVASSDTIEKVRRHRQMKKRPGKSTERTVWFCKGSPNRLDNRILRSIVVVGLHLAHHVVV